MPKHSPKTGFTLVEVLVSVSILAVVFITLANIITKSLSVSQHSRDRAQANKILQGANEWLRMQRDSQGYDNFVLADCALNIDTGNIPTQDGFTVEVDAEKVAGEVDCDQKIKVTTTVSWEGESVSSVTYFSKW